jgi:hypothetical protein
MSGAIIPLPQYAFMVWCLVKAQEQLCLYFLIRSCGWMEVWLLAFLTSTLGPAQPPIQWVLGIYRPGRDDDHSPPSSAKVKNARSYTSIPPVSTHGMVLRLPCGDFSQP